MKNRIIIKGEQNLTIWQKNDAFDILSDISEDVTLVKLMDSIRNANHAISVVGYWIFDSNYNKSLCLTQELLNIICSTSIDEELVVKFRSIFYAVRYSWAPGNIKKDKHDTFN